ncbi:MAG: 5-(carboxyamino)imidazole ribonucleotide mutase [Acidobacteria bacterium]|nr:MAG: 5-(carboxyamino)imidazole ribonucleotide mutase [Acidobacteriota bacterium]
MTHKARPLVGIVMGSDSDMGVMAEAARTLKRFGVPFEIEIASAHRSPARASEYARTAVERGLKVIVIAAGGAAHLGGVMAAETFLPVIGVPIASTPLAGLDSLLSIVQMPGGVPVACTSIGKPGAVNAAVLAVEILATGDARLSARLADYKAELARAVAGKSERVKRGFRS